MQPIYLNLIRGFTIIELTITLILSSIIFLLAVPSYQKYIQHTNLRTAKAALLKNSNHLERYYLQKTTFKKNSTTWPQLPHPETLAFNISFTGKARGVPSGQYKLTAIAKPNTKETRYLTIDHNQNIFLCEKVNNRHRCSIY